MSKVKIKFTRKDGNQYHFEVRKIKIVIEDGVLINGRNQSNLHLNNGSYGWRLNKLFVSLHQAEYACGEYLTDKEWFINNMKNNPELWGRNLTRNEIPMTKGCIKIIDRAGSDYRVRYFEDNRAKNDLLKNFMMDIKNLTGYGIGLSYR